MVKKCLLLVDSGCVVFDDFDLVFLVALEDCLVEPMQDIVEKTFDLVLIASEILLERVGGHVGLEAHDVFEDGEVWLEHR